MNEASLFAARANKRLVDMDDLERAMDKIMMGKMKKWYSERVFIEQASWV